MKKFILTILILLGGIYVKGQNPDSLRYELIKYAQKYLYVRETSINRSIEIDSFNTNVGAPLGSPWCASYISYIYDFFNIDNPSSAWSPSWGLKENIVYRQKQTKKVEIKPGDVICLYYSKLNRIGHVGIVICIDEKFIYTIEGNTNVYGSREGDGVYLKKRELSKIYCITRYIK